MKDHDDKPDDLDAFREAVSDVKPLKTDRTAPEPPKPPAAARFRRADDELVLQESLEGGPGMDDLEEVAYRRPDVPQKELLNLRRGRYSIESELDLHGLTAATAREALDEFLAECRDLDQHCVRVIHGKGRRSGQRGPVLKPKVCQWLRRRGAVRAFVTAPRRDGGIGALYVLLD